MWAPFSGYAARFALNYKCSGDASFESQLSYYSELNDSIDDRISGY